MILSFPKLIVSFFKTALTATSKINEIHTLLLLQQSCPSLLKKALPTVPALEEAYAQSPLKTLVIANVQISGSQLLLRLAKDAVSIPYSATVQIFQEALNASGFNKDAALAEFIRYQYCFGLNDAHLLQLCEAYAASEWAWGKEKYRKHVWCRYIGILLEHGQTDAALAIVRRYHTIYGLSSLEQFLPAAHFAHNNGFSNTAIAQAAYIVDEVQKNIHNGVLAEYLHNKRVAVVGSGPYEIGRGRGKEIDSHDTVIRFNHAIITAEASKDYGTQTHILSRNYARPFSYSTFPKTKLLYLAEGITRFPLHAQAVAALANDSKKLKRILVAPTRQDFQNTCKQFDYTRFTSGFLCVAHVKAISKQLSIDNLYGFSFKEEGQDDFRSEQGLYYFKPEPGEFIHPSPYTVHDLNQEKAAFQQLFASHARN